MTIAPVALPLPRLALLGLLLLAELTVLSVRFDLRPAPTGLHLRLAVLADLGMGAAAAGLVFGRKALWVETLRLCGQPRSPTRLLLLATGQIVTFLVFFRATAVVLERQGTSHGWEYWLVAWMTTGGLAVLLWVALLVAPCHWAALFQRGWRTFLLAVGIGLAVLVASGLTARLWLPIGRWTLDIVRVLVHAGAGHVLCDADHLLVGTRSFQVHVAPACSGYQGMGLVAIFLLCYLHFERATLRFPQALLLLPVGIFVIWLANAGRIAVLILIGSWWSPGVALGGFHSQAGWLAFLLVALGLVVFARQCPWLSRVETQEPVDYTLLPYLGPLVTLLLACMVTRALSNSLDQLYFLAILTAGFLLWQCRQQLPPLRCSRSWRPLLLGAAAYGLWIVMDPGPADLQVLRTFEREHAALSPLSRALWTSSRLLGSIVVVPLAEELAFRGFLARRLIARDFEALPLGRFTLASLMASSLLFGLMHGRWLAGSLAGLLYAVALMRHGRLGDAVVAHGTTNGLIAVHVLWGETWHLWL